MAEVDAEPLCEPVLNSIGVAHAFGQRAHRKAPGPPALTLFPKQIHGVAVATVQAGDAPEALANAEADAILTRAAGVSVGIVTADCVPLLAASEDGAAVVAIHAGWRGLAAGVIEKGLAALAAAVPGKSLRVAIGPAARGCCYEVDEPVRVGLVAQYEALLSEEILTPGESQHYQLDLPRLAARVAARFGVAQTHIGVAQSHCTICEPERFESYRRDGASAGRMRHFITVPA